MDPFSDLIRLIRLNVSIFHNALVCGDWRLESEQSDLASFHIITLGSCRLEVPGYAHRLLNAGDLIIFPHGFAHRLVPIELQTGPQLHVPYQENSGHQGTGILCGALHFVRATGGHLFNALPSFLVVPKTDNAHWTAPIVDMIIQESVCGAVASDVILDRLSEMLVMYALRHHLLQQPSNAGILALYCHPRLRHALAALHRQPDFNWTLDSLAKNASQSRTQFAKTFREISGWTPLQYLTWWRMQLAWSYLQEGLDVGSTASRVGYLSESAFLRVFKKTFNQNAGAVRRAQTVRAAKLGT